MRSIRLPCRGRPVTKISWVINPDGTAGDVWNWWTGCTKFSDGCDHCYAETLACGRLKGRGGYPANNPFKPTYHADKINLPLKWKKPRTVFSCSMGDWMHDDITTEQIDAFLRVVNSNRRHTVLTLTKRTGNLFNKLYVPNKNNPTRYFFSSGAILPNLYLGATIELAKYLHRLEELLAVPAAGYFLSLEPLLGPITIPPQQLKRLAVVIVGGENGPGARPMHPAWVRSIRDQCLEARVPFFFKGWGEWVEVEPGSPPGAYSTDKTFWVSKKGKVSWCGCIGDPDGLYMRKVGSKYSGHKLDGQKPRQLPWVGR